MSHLLQGYDRRADEFMRSVHDFVQEMFGDRCDDFDPDCPTCKLWQLHDQMREIVIMD
jgi:hypothetical protein